MVDTYTYTSTYEMYVYVYVGRHASAWLDQNYYKADLTGGKRHATGRFDIPPYRNVIL